MLKRAFLAGCGAHASHPGTQEAEAEDVGLRPDWARFVRPSQSKKYKGNHNSKPTKGWGGKSACLACVGPEVQSPLLQKETTMKNIASESEYVRRSH
jgi:hypothetical protein